MNGISQTFEFKRMISLNDENKSCSSCTITKSSKAILHKSHVITSPSQPPSRCEYRRKRRWIQIGIQSRRPRALCRRWYILTNFKACISLTSKPNVGLCLKYNHHTVSKIRKLFFCGSTAPSGPRTPHYRHFTITLRHTTLGRLLWTCDLFIAETSTGQHKHSHTQTSMSPAGFETATPTSERPQTHALDGASTNIGNKNTDRKKFR